MIYFNKIYEVQKHLTLTRHIYNNMIHTVGVNSWKKLTPEQQTIFREESKSSGELMRKLMADSETDQINKLEKAGMQITRPDLAPFRAKWIPPTSGLPNMPARTTSRNSARSSKNSTRD